MPLIALCALMNPMSSPNIEYLHQVAREVTSAARVEPGGEISNGGKNTTGHALRVPGGTQTYYPAFWIRDAAMMLGADLVGAEEVEGWIRVIAAIQPGPAGIRFDHGLIIPAYSIPDHITLDGQACWFPGAYTNQGVGDYGFLPPADDAFYFIQMVHEQFRLTRTTQFLKSKVQTAWGRQPVADVAAKAFDSVAVDDMTGLVQCDAEKGKNRVDWGFCDSVSKSGSCLMPSLLRWQAARWLADLTGKPSYRSVSDQIKKGILSTLYKPLQNGEAMLFSATGLGHNDDVWGSAFAVSIGILPHKEEAAIARHLLRLYRTGGIVVNGQVRQVPPEGEFGGNWDKASSSPGSYQNGGYWATPTGWLVAALRKVDKKAADQLLLEFITDLKANRAKGAPFEWINPSTNSYANPNYGSSAGLVYVSLRQAGYR